jgi:hypothetical protein
LFLELKRKQKVQADELKKMEKSEKKKEKAKEKAPTKTKTKKPISRPRAPSSSGSHSEVENEFSNHISTAAADVPARTRDRPSRAAAKKAHEKLKQFAETIGDDQDQKENEFEFEQKQNIDSVDQPEETKTYLNHLKTEPETKMKMVTYIKNKLNMLKFH